VNDVIAAQYNYGNIRTLLLNMVPGLTQTKYILFSGLNQLITRFYYIHLKRTSFNG